MAYYIERLSGYIASTGKKYKNHTATIRRWAADDTATAAPKQGIPEYTCKAVSYTHLDVYKRQAYYLQVYSYTISLAQNREIAEEITQNTFYKAVSTTSQRCV